MGAHVKSSRDVNFASEACFVGENIIAKIFEMGKFVPSYA